MADHFFALNRGLDGLKPVEIIRGTAAQTSPAAADLELRIADAAGWTRGEVCRALEALENLFESAGNAPDGTNFPPL